jgi:hypothetical protein
LCYFPHRIRQMLCSYLDQAITQTSCLFSHPKNQRVLHGTHSIQPWPAELKFGPWKRPPAQQQQGKQAPALRARVFTRAGKQ